MGIVINQTPEKFMQEVLARGMRKELEDYRRLNDPGYLVLAEMTHEELRNTPNTCPYRSECLEASEVIGECEKTFRDCENYEFFWGETISHMKQ